MGKRKKSSKPAPTSKKSTPLATTFDCLFCNHDKSIVVKLDKKLGLGTLNCKVCGQRFQSSINYLSAAVDVYSDWIDACEGVAVEAAEREARRAERDEGGDGEERVRAPEGEGGGRRRLVGGASDGERRGGAVVREDIDDDY